MPSATQPRRIAIVGNAGTGKSTLALEVGRHLGLDVVHLDRLLWRPGWQIVPEREFRSAHAKLVASEAWVIEGLGYPSTLEALIAAADVAIFLRYPLWRCYLWSLKRELSRSRAGRPQDCPMLPAAAKLARAIWRTQRDVVPQIDRLLERHAGEKEIHVLRSPAEAGQVLGRLIAGRR